MTAVPPAFRGPVSLLADCIALYGDGVVDISAEHDHEVVVPLPPGARATRITALTSAGEQPHRHSTDPAGVLVFVPARTGPISAIRIRWET